VGLCGICAACVAQRVGSVGSTGVTSAQNEGCPATSSTDFGGARQGDSLGGSSLPVLHATHAPTGICYHARAVCSFVRRVMRSVGTNVLLADVAPAAPPRTDPTSSWILATDLPGASGADDYASSPAARSGVASVPSSLEPLKAAMAPPAFPPPPLKVPILRSQSLPSESANAGAGRGAAAAGRRPTTGEHRRVVDSPPSPLPGVRENSESSVPSTAPQTVYGNALQKLQAAGHGEPVTAHFVPSQSCQGSVCFCRRTALASYRYSSRPWLRQTSTVLPLLCRL